jgi:N utilization substance protein A
MNSELLAVLDYMERERGIDRETLFKVLESMLLSAAKKSTNGTHDVRVAIDHKTGDIKAYAKVLVVERVNAPQDEIALDRAQRLQPCVKLGDFIEIERDTKGLFGRIAAQMGKQSFLHNIRKVEKDKVYEEYKDRPGEIVSGTVRRFERSDVVVDLGRAEALLPAKERVPTEEYQPGDRIRALILGVDNTTQGAVITLSRSHPDFVRRLFELEVSEIADKTVEIRAIAREAGFRSKIAVLSRDEKVDPVGACVGMRGIRVKNIVRELSGEKIDIVRWHDDVKTFVTNALAPAKLLHVDISEPDRTVYITVAADQLSLAIGKKGQNARLTAKLTGWKVEIKKDESEVSFEDQVAKAVAALAAIPGIGPERAAKLVHAGFLTAEGILAAELSDLEAVEGFDAESAGQVRAAVEAATAAPGEASPVDAVPADAASSTDQELPSAAAPESPATPGGETTTQETT